VGEGNLQLSFEEKARFLNLEDKIFFLGKKSQIALAEVYSNCDTLIMASTNEVWGMVASEALASGCHVVVSSKCGISNFIRDMQGVYICGTDETSIAEMMKRSREEYTTKISNPEILQYSPEKYIMRLMNIITS
jgi:glycosyltransferase involved in cell wall biosynthesis